MTTPTVFALGSNSNGQLGLGHTSDVSTPKSVVFHPHPPTCGVKKIAAGGNHTLLLTQRGELWATGDNKTGACCGPDPPRGRATTSNPPPHVFTQVPLPDTKVTHITCTWSASIVVCEQSRDAGPQTVITFGSGPNVELGRLSNGRKDMGKIMSFPPNNTRIVDIASSLNHVVAVLSDGTVWGWGASRKGQLGDQTDSIVPTPKCFAGLGFKAHRVACAKECTVIFGSPAEGHVLVCGGTKLGIPEQLPSQIPHYTDVGAGWSAVYVLSADGTVSSWGRDNYRQMAPPGLPPVVEIAVGSEHVLALTETGEVVSWGWGEHGNCGPMASDNTVLKGKWNVIANAKFLKDTSRIYGIGAGCATSWVLIETLGLVL